MLSVDHLTVNNYVRVNPFFLSWMNINVEFKKKKKICDIWELYNSTLYKGVNYRINIFKKFTSCITIT